MKLRIVNGTGASKHTSVFDENGNDLAAYITEMTLHFPLSGIITADIKLININIDVVASLGMVTKESEEDVKSNN